MTIRTLPIITVFLMGYAVNDLAQAFDLTFLAPAQAYSSDFESAVKDIVSGCEVIVYDGGSGEVIC